jgi:hypothetical protein
VQYRRRTDDDLWIVSHIPEFVDELDCHIHVDVASTVNVFMYLYKYLFKGPDRTSFHISQASSDDDDRVDEAEDYVNARYLCSVEAGWRILGFHITSKYPSVDCLPVHLPGQNSLSFRQEGGSASLLIRYFHRPTGLEFDNLLYSEYYRNYILESHNQLLPLRTDRGERLEQPINGAQQRRVHHRQVGEKVTRLATISPTHGELFYLRCLLQHCAARSFTELRTVNNIIYHTYHEAAQQLGLFDDMNEGHYALQEAVDSFVLPRQLRFLFARVILEGYPARPLWNRFNEYLALDLIDSASSVEQGIDLALQDIAELLRDGGRSLTNYGLPEPLIRTLEVAREHDAFVGRYEALAEEALRAKTSFSNDQASVFDAIHNCVELYRQYGHRHGIQHLFFIEGRPGRGKTFLVDAICSSLRSDGLIILIVGTTALAATLYERGRTAHSLFGIPVNEVRISSN